MVNVSISCIKVNRKLWFLYDFQLKRKHNSLHIGIFPLHRKNKVIHKSLDYGYTLKGTQLLLAHEFKEHYKFFQMSSCVVLKVIWYGLVFSIYGILYLTCIWSYGKENNPNFTWSYGHSLSLLQLEIW